MGLDAGAEGLTREVARFILAAGRGDIPASVIEAGKKSILDGFGLALAGSAAESGHLVQTYLDSLGLNTGPSTVIGTALKVPARFAAFANGVAIHADDFDDTQLAVAKDRVYGLLTHPTAPCLPAVLANAEALGRPGEEAMLAYHIGLEVECKIAEAINPRHYQDGFHATGTCGAFASAAANAKLRGFDLDKTLRALSIAASQSAGLRENFGTMTKPFHAGRARKPAWWPRTSPRWAGPRPTRSWKRRAASSSAAGGGYDAGAISGKLGNPWTFDSPGVSIKPHPSGSLTHPGMTLMLKLIREHGIKADRIERVDVGTNQQYAQRPDPSPAAE